MGNEVPTTDPYIQKLNDPPIDDAGSHWYGSWGWSVGVGWIRFRQATMVYVSDKQVAFNVAVQATYRFSTYVSVLNHTTYRHYLNGWYSTPSAMLGWKHLLLTLPVGNWDHRLEANATAGVCDMEIEFCGIAKNNGDEVTAYKGSIANNLVPPFKSKYEYWAYPDSDVTLLANHDWPANVLIQRDPWWLG